MRLIGARRHDRLASQPLGQLSGFGLDGSDRPADGRRLPAKYGDRDGPSRDERRSPDNVVVAGGSAFYSDGARVIRLAADRTPETIAAMPGAVTAIAGAPDGTLAIATISGGISFVGPRQSTLRALRIEAGQGDITAMAFVDAERLAITVGSQVTPGSKWVKISCSCAAPVRHGSATWCRAQQRRLRTGSAIPRASSAAGRKNWWSPKPG